MKFPEISREERIRRLTPQTGVLHMVLDTDTYNEVDDQFALAYALSSPEKLAVEAVYAAPFSSSFFSRYLNSDNIGIPMTSDLEQGLEQSYQEILKIFRMLGKAPENRVFRGSRAYMKTPGEPVESDAARDLVRRAMASEGPLYVVSIGEITNIASAILMEPRIIDRIVVVWLSGQPLYWPQTIEFNLGQDILASQTVLDCGVPLVFIPCMSVASHLTTTEAELNAKLNGKSEIGTYLSKIVIDQLSERAANGMLELLRKTYLRGVQDYPEAVVRERPAGPMACSRIVWDISTIGYMVNPNWCPSTLVPTPMLQPDLTWKLDPQRPLMRLCHFIYRDGIFGDMFDKLSRA
jgi:purine nucleosidase